ncbi:hypothetical protein ATZ33_09880 [Enterococcus silesiacus]|uniref:Permease IIC component n=1 Tax=Enterococcus silesiacus TaxID=332949 RepID=A0A0S3KBR3_9ENTE|nr:PTS transporter subunit EIIC [Enterococcus silesiacus]ALS01668.1 hypothetical protein ATZ33_09880 [Enterococcus silesiacus]OJG91431.1 hypothetical protein RV15_GL000708 [Enterococcus silesiacus]
MTKKGNFNAKLQQFVVKFTNLLVIRTIANGMVRILPVTMVGSIAAILLNGIQFQWYLDFLESSGLGHLLQLGSSMTTDLITVYVILSLSAAMAKNLERSQYEGIMSAFLVYFIITPTTTVKVGEKTVQAFDFSVLGSKGMFVGMIVAILIPYLYSKILDRNWRIKLPDAVPPMVANSFSALIPVILLATGAIIFNGLFAATPFGDIHTAIYTVLQTPLKHMSDSVITMLVIVGFGEILWWFGIHGSSAIGAITATLYLPPLIENITAYANGQALPSILNEGLLNVYKGPRHLALAMLLIFACRSIQLKSVGKVAIIPSFFGISEPMKFGIPMVLNPSLFFPMFLAPIISITMAYFAISWGLVPRVGVQLPWALPPVISGFIAGGWRGATLQILQFTASVLLYLPFIKSLDKQKLIEEVKLEGEN